MLNDKVQGMLLLSAYGDALGAPFENLALSENGIFTHSKEVVLVKGDEIESSRFENPWAIWINQERVKHKKGIFTDDTYYRWALLHPWLFDHACPKSVNQLEFQSFFQNYPKQVLNSFQLNACCQSQFKDWQLMWHAHLNRQSALFYHQNVPIAFGLFQCLDLVLLYHQESPQTIYQCFKVLNPLDQQYGKLITGLFACLIHQGLKAREVINAQIIFQLMDDLRANSELDNESEYWAMICSCTEKAFDIGKRSHETEIAFHKAVRLEIFLNNNLAHYNWPLTCGTVGRNNHDPLLLWMQLIATATYAEFDAVYTIKLLAGGVGDCDTLAALAGLLFGAWLGKSYFYQDDMLKYDLDCVNESLYLLFDETVELRSERLIGYINQVI